MVTVKAPTNRRHHRGVPLKSAKDRMDIISAYYELGSYRGAADRCGIDRHEAEQAGIPPAPRVERPHNYDSVAELVTERVEKSQGRISAKRLLPIARICVPHRTRPVYLLRTSLNASRRHIASLNLTTRSCSELQRVALKLSKRF